MPGKTRAHYAGSYQVRARLVRRLAYANPETRCWRCGRTLEQHPAHRNGRLAFWTAGHVVDGDPGSLLAAEASVCNLSAGAAMGNRQRAKVFALSPSRKW